MKTFKQKLEAKWAKGKFACVGLDPDLERFPTHLKKRDVEEQLLSFFTEIVLHTASIVAAFKPHTAFFVAFGAPGTEAYEAICNYIKDLHPRAILICDAKRGDIGKTNFGSVKFLFDRCRADAVTVHNYLGKEANQPFLNRADKGVFVLCKTSNPGSGEFQDRQVVVSAEEAKMFNLPAEKQSAPPDNELTIEEAALMVREEAIKNRHMPSYQFVAARVNHFWNGKDNCGLVTGATYPEEIKKVRQVAPNLPLLIPGIGTQNGDLEGSVRNALVRGGGFIISSSSDTLYASQGKDFAKAARVKAMELDKQIRALVEKR